MKKQLLARLTLGCFLSLLPFVAFANPTAPPVANPTVRTVLLPAAQMLEIQELLPSFVKAEKLTCSIIYGQQPKMIIIGDASAVNRLSDLIAYLGTRPVTKDLIYITASMEDVVASSGGATGVNINDIPIAATWTRTNVNTAANKTFSPESRWSLQAGKTSETLATLKLRTSKDDNRLLIAGQIVTTNGMVGNLIHAEEVPYTVVNANGSSQILYSKAETIIRIKPTLLDYNATQPEKSLIKLDINLQISVIGDQSNLYSDVNPVITTRHLAVTRILPADNIAAAVAAVTHDEDLLVEQGVPFLNKLPLLKYLFSQKTTIKERSVSVLKLAVRFVPQEKLTDDDVKAVLSATKGGKIVRLAKLIALILLLNLLYISCGQAEPIYRTVVIPQEMLVASLRLLEDTAGRLGVTYSLFNGSAPEIVLRGEPDNIQQVLLLLEECHNADAVNDLININCSLHSLQEGDILSLGFLPARGVQATGYVQRNNTSLATDIWELTLATFDSSYLKLQQTLNRGNIVISGDITTTNGLRGELSTKQSLPLSVNTGVANIASVTYKDVITDVKVTPTVLVYDSESPTESKVRLDIHVKISTVNKTADGNNVYPYIASREYDITRIVKANNQPYITAAIVRDKHLKTAAGIPLLKDLPLLKYLFSCDYTRNVREYDILKINVSFLPFINKSVVP